MVQQRWTYVKRCPAIGPAESVEPPLIIKSLTDVSIPCDVYQNIDTLECAI